MLPTYRAWYTFLILICLSRSASVLGSVGYPGVFDTGQVLHLHLAMDPADFAAIRTDLSFSVEVPAQFWADGEDPILVSIRRKSADSINGKVSYKIDINDFVSGQKWNDLTKLSMENGDDQDVVSEGLAWYMHRVASGGLASYSPGLAAWTTLTVNGEHQGVYLHAEQVNKQFLRNRGLWSAGETWLFFQDDIGRPRYKEGPTEASPTMEALNFAPFAAGPGQVPPAPEGAELRALLDEHINVEALLTLGAVNAFTGNPDELFNKGKNFFWADFQPGTSPADSGGKRMYFPWDLDSAIQGPAASIYGEGGGGNPKHGQYQALFLNDPVFREQYSQIMLSLLAGPLSVESLVAFLDDMEPVLTPYLVADPNNRIGDDIAGHFDSLRNWVRARHANVFQQLLADMGTVAIPGDFNGDGVVDAADYTVWRDELGSEFTPDDYIVWKHHFALAATPSTRAGFPVPEPCTAILILVGTWWGMARRPVRLAPPRASAQKPSRI